MLEKKHYQYKKKNMEILKFTFNMDFFASCPYFFLVVEKLEDLFFHERPQHLLFHLSRYISNIQHQLSTLDNQKGIREGSRLLLKKLI